LQGKIKYHFTATLWKHSGVGGWHFVSVPHDLAQEIRTHLHWQEEGWGRLKVTAVIDSLRWPTAIWFDTKSNTYLLPIKAAIRTQCGLQPGDAVGIELLV
jgi:hypothetical protein